MENIRSFLEVNSGYGYGSGSGDGDGSGSGYGDGSGSGYGDGYGSGSGYGDGYGSGYGSGSGDGSGDGSGSSSGYGSGDGSGDGSGSSYGIKSINNMKIHIIDGIPTIISKLKNNIAKGFILQQDLALTPCYVIKSGNCFSHGETIHKARESLETKLFRNMNVDEKIELFIRKFNFNEQYPAKEFYDWHNKLTGSCEMGRKVFCKNHGINIEKDNMTVKEFIELTENDFGGSVIKKIKECMKNE